MLSELVAIWRDRAKASWTGDDPVSKTYSRCANELEMVWHDYAHDTIRSSNCPICQQEWKET